MGNEEQGLIPADQQFLKQLERFGIQIIGRLIEHQHVGRLQKEAGEQQAVAFATGEQPRRHAHAVGAEEEITQVTVDVAVAALEMHRLRDAGHVLRHCLVQIDLIPQLIQIHDLQIGPRGHLPGLRGELPQKQFEQRGLATPIRTQNSDLVPAEDLGGKVLDQRLGHFRVREGDALRPQNPLTRHRARLDLHLGRSRTLAAACPFPAQVKQGTHPPLIAGATCFDSLTQPRFLLGQFFVEGFPLNGLGFQHTGFALEEGVIVTGPTKKPSAIQLDNPVGQTPEKSPVVRDKKQAHRVTEQKILQPEDGSEVQVVRRLIKQEQIRLPGQRPGQQHAAFQSAGKRGERGLRRQLHFGQQILQPHINLPILLVPGRRNPAPHHREHRPLHPLGNFLIQAGHDRSGRAQHIPRARPLLAGNESHQAGLATAIASEQSHSLALLYR